MGETTWLREQVDRGIEADLSYFFDPEKIEAVRDAERRESNKVEDYPNPDLVVEVDISPPQADRDGIYAALRVPEVWVFDGEHLSDLEARRRGEICAGRGERMARHPGGAGREVADARGQVRPQGMDQASGGMGPRGYGTMNLPSDFAAWQTAVRRRTFLRSSAYGLGGIALAGLLDPSLFSGTARGAADTTRPGDRWRGVLNPPHRPIKAKRVIHLCMAGGPSQFETLRLQAELKELARQAVPRIVHEGAATRPAPEHGAQGARAVLRLPQAWASRARRSPTCSRTSRASPTRSASSARCTPSRSTTTRRTRS